MATSYAINPLSQSHQFDKRSFVRYMNKHGTAYHNQAMELIKICREYSFARAAEQIFSQDTELSIVLQACDNALAEATEAGKGTSVSSDHRINRAIQKLENYEKRFYPRSQSAVDGVRGRMKKAKNDDKKGLWHKLLHPKGTSSPSRVVNFRLLASIIDAPSQHTVIRQVLTNDSNLQEILWNFSRYRDPTAGSSEIRRVTLAKNPHFYCQDHLHFSSPNAYQDEFTTDPMDHYQGVDDICVLTNKPGRVFLESGENSRAFDNVWRANGILIFKSVCGKLEGERIVGALIEGRSWWFQTESLPFQHQVESAVDLPNPPSTSAIPTSTTDTPAWVPVEDWRKVISYLLPSQDIMIRIKIVTEPIPNSN